jgi:hypothetical protein
VRNTHWTNGFEMHVLRVFIRVPVKFSELLMETV